MTDVVARSIPCFPIDAAGALAEVTGSIDSIVQTLRVSRAILDTGRVVCLDGLEAQVAQLCARCLGLEREDGNSLRPHLLGLRAELDVTAVVMSARQEAVPCPSTTS